MCVVCYKKSDHSHKSQMSRLGLDLNETNNENTGGDSDAKPANAQEARSVSINSYIQSLVHACHCLDPNCRLHICQKMKRFVSHIKSCKRRQGCKVCKQLLMLCWQHAKVCKETKCPVPSCMKMKQRLEQQRLDAQFKNNQLLRRSMAIMQRAPDRDQTPQAQPTSDPPTPTMSMPHGYSGNGKFLQPQSQSPPTQGPHSASTIAAQQAEQMAQTQGQAGVGSGYGPMMAAGMPIQQRMMMQQMGQQMGNPMGNPNHTMDQGNFHNPTMFMNKQRDDVSPSPVATTAIDML